MAFPHGAPPSTAANLTALFHLTLPAGTPPGAVLTVHPTQLYEIALTFVVFLLLWRWRERRHAAGWLFGAYLILSSIERIIVEVFRAKDDRVLGPVSVAQLLSAALVLIGVWLMRRNAAEGEAVRRQE
jgi:phosphatidylglycerol:prolipoprotein diacylglycerol transferase